MAICNSKNTLGLNKVAWSRKTAAAAKRTDIWDRGQDLYNHNTPWDKIVRSSMKFERFMN